MKQLFILWNLLHTSYTHLSFGWDTAHQVCTTFILTIITSTDSNENWHLTLITGGLKNGSWYIEKIIIFRNILMNICVKRDVYHLVTSVRTRKECQKDCYVSYRCKGMSETPMVSNSQPHSQRYLKTHVSAFFSSIILVNNFLSAGKPVTNLISTPCGEIKDLLNEFGTFY